MASAYIQQGRYREAEAEYRAVIKVVPTNFYPYLKLGDLKLAQGKTDEARELYSTALVLSRGLPYAYAKLGTLLLMQDKATEALPLLQRAAVLAQKRADFNRESRGRLYYALAVALAKTGRVSEAVRAARKAAEWLPNDAGVQQLLQQLGAK
ncbi:MAG: tetratricopeptide repeat protein [Calditrichaeota bacterium]|nr:tetratricopeptide repeat protein [Calditrichota bacterium]